MNVRQFLDEVQEMLDEGDIEETSEVFLGSEFNDEDGEFDSLVYVKHLSADKDEDLILSAEDPSV